MMENTEFITHETQIIEAVKQVFIRKEYDDATMSDVAKEEGMERTALHYYFRTKEILLGAIIGQFLSLFLPDLGKVCEREGNIFDKMPEFYN